MKVRSSLAVLMPANVNVVRAVMSFITSPGQDAVMEAVMAQMLVDMQSITLVADKGYCACGCGIVHA